MSTACRYPFKFKWLLLRRLDPLHRRRFYFERERDHLLLLFVSSLLRSVS